MIRQIKTAAAPLQYQPQPPFLPEYFCPRQANYWQPASEPVNDLAAACKWAEILKPPAGSARVTDRNGVEVFSI